MSIVGTRRTLTFDELAGRHALHVSEHGNTTPARVALDEVDVLVAQCSHFTSCVRRGDPTGGNGAHGLDVVRVLEAGSRSARVGGTPVEVA
jgi:predicted dehydrogenase